MRERAEIQASGKFWSDFCLSLSETFKGSKRSRFPSLTSVWNEGKQPSLTFGCGFLVAKTAQFKHFNVKSMSPQLWGGNIAVFYVLNKFKAALADAVSAEAFSRPLVILWVRAGTGSRRGPLHCGNGCTATQSGLCRPSMDEKLPSLGSLSNWESPLFSLHLSPLSARPGGGGQRPL